jgi:N-acetylglucosamine-6-phosphate deacetylase
VLIAADTLLTGAELLRPGWIDLAGDSVRAVGAGHPPVPADHTAAVVVPGFVDTHVHGGAGADFSAGTLAATSAAVGLHRRHGSTTLIASLVTAAPDDLMRQVGALAEHTRAGLIDGIHLEGPWLSVHRCGAHDASLMRDLDPVELTRILDAGGGAVRMVTLAPERAGALEAIATLTDAGVVAAVGHTEAGYAQTRAAIEAGATVGTHLFNAMRPIGHRAPGPIVALLEDPRVTVELITDGVHVDPAIYRHVCRSSDRVSLITDAMAATGGADGHYLLGTMSVEVWDGKARVAGTDTIAGSTATMDAVFRFAVAHSGLGRDDALLQAVRQATINPARALGLSRPGLVPGAPADVVTMDADLGVTGTLYRGSWVVTPGGDGGVGTATP